MPAPFWLLSPTPQFLRVAKILENLCKIDDKSLKIEALRVPGALRGGLGVILAPSLDGFGVPKAPIRTTLGHHLVAQRHHNHSQGGPREPKGGAKVPQRGAQEGSLAGQNGPNAIYSDQT